MNPIGEFHEVVKLKKIEEDKTTITLIFENNDPNLTNEKWKRYTNDIKNMIDCYTEEFLYFSLTNLVTGCLVFEINTKLLKKFKKNLNSIIRSHEMQAVTIVSGKTEYIPRGLNDI